MLVIGFVVYEILSEWGASKRLLMWLPNRLTEAAGISGSVAGMVSAIVMFVLFPGILFFAVVFISKICSKVSVRTVVESLALLLLPTMAGAHVIKALLKMTSRIPYWRHALSDTTGITVAQRIFDNTLSLDKSVPNSLYPVLNLIIVVVLVIALAASLLIVRKSPALARLDTHSKGTLALGTILYWSVFSVMILMWRF
jgi:hypothetical protein